MQGTRHPLHGGMAKKRPTVILGGRLGNHPERLVYLLGRKVQTAERSGPELRRQEAIRARGDGGGMLPIAGLGDVPLRIRNPDGLVAVSGPHQAQRSHRSSPATLLCAISAGRDLIFEVKLVFPQRLRCWRACGRLGTRLWLLSPSAVYLTRGLRGSRASPPPGPCLMTDRTRCGVVYVYITGKEGPTKPCIVHSKALRERADVTHALASLQMRRFIALGTLVEIFLTGDPAVVERVPFPSADPPQIPTASGGRPPSQPPLQGSTTRGVETESRERNREALTGFKGFAA